MRNAILFSYLLFFSNFIAGCYKNSHTEKLIPPHLSIPDELMPAGAMSPNFLTTDQPTDLLCQYQGEFSISENGITQAQTTHGTLILNPFNNTIAIISEIDIVAIEVLQVDQPAAQCYLEHPAFACNELVCVVTVPYYEFWDCATSNETFYYRFLGNCAPVPSIETHHQ